MTDQQQRRANARTFTAQQINKLLTQVGIQSGRWMVSLGVGDRALHLAWTVEAGPANIGFDAQKLLLEPVRSGLPAGAEVLLADRFYPSVELFAWLHGQDWHYRLRLRRADTVGVTAKDNRLFVEAVLYRYRAGIPWRDVPERFGAWKAVHTRSSRWAESGIWQTLFKHGAVEADHEYALIDSTIVRAHPHRAGAKKEGQDEAIGRSKGGLRTKIHATTDALGNPTRFMLAPGPAHDRKGADRLLPDLKAEALLADRAYNADERVRVPLQKAGMTAVIPSKSNRIVQRDYDKDLYEARHLIENFFCKLKQYRAIATRYDKTARNFLAAIDLASTVIWLN